MVGALQYHVVVSRLRKEYRVAADIEPAGYTAARWLGNFTGRTPSLPGQSVPAVDRQGRSVLLFDSAWALEDFEQQHPIVPLLSESPGDAPQTSRRLADRRVKRASGRE